MLHILNRVVLILQKLSPYLVFKMFTKLCQYPCFYFYIRRNYSISTNRFFKSAHNYDSHYYRLYVYVVFLYWISKYV